MNANQYNHAVTQIIFGIYDLMVPLNGPIEPDLGLHAQVVNSMEKYRDALEQLSWHKTFTEKPWYEIHMNGFNYSNRQLIEVIYGAMCSLSLDHRKKNTTQFGMESQLKIEKKIWQEIMLQRLYHRIPNDVLHEMDNVGFAFDCLAMEEAKYLPHVNQLRIWLNHCSKGKIDTYDNNLFQLMSEIDRIKDTDIDELNPISPKHMYARLDDIEKRVLNQNARFVDPLILLKYMMDESDTYEAKTLYIEPTIEEI